MKPAKFFEEARVMRRKKVRVESLLKEFGLFGTMFEISTVEEGRQAYALYRENKGEYKLAL